MSMDFYSAHGFPLSTEDLQICQRVFDAICEAKAIPKTSDQAQDLAALIIEIYRQGVHDPITLRRLAEP